MRRPGVCAPLCSAQHHVDVRTQQHLFGAVGAVAGQGGLGRYRCGCGCRYLASPAAVAPRVHALHGSCDGASGRHAQRIRPEGYDGSVWRQARRNARRSQQGDL